MADDKKIEPEYVPLLIGKRGLSLHDEEFGQRWPTLYQLLAPRYDSKQRLTREPGVISIRVDGSMYRITLVCPTEGVQTTLEKISLVDLWDFLELHVCSPSATWPPTYDAKKRAGHGLRKVLES
jgi:hypothetical protein